MSYSLSSHSAPSSSSRSCKYDVFLSFRGEDTRKTFVDHLYSALVDRHIHTYKDDETLPRGESIGPSLFKAIEESRIAIVIFSKNYADSFWCLEELAYIMKCRGERDLIVMPIFYDVDPSDVRNQRKKFGEAFTKQEEQNDLKAELWRKTLVDASNISGWETKHIANGHESKVIKEVIGTILDKLFLLNSDADENLIGMKPRLYDLKSRLEIGSDGVRMVGIWGVGGGGKTTLASSLYMEISCYFEAHHIVENIGEESSKYGLKKLQENILSAFFKTKVEVPSVVEGKGKIKSMLCRKNVLLVLDDVNHLDQLDALAGSHNWFGSGSRIVITTRDEHLLRTHKVDNVCHVKLLSDNEAIQLFNIHAYNENNPIEDYKTLSLRVVSYAGGLPLALRVLGSFLYDKEKKGWLSTLDRLKDIPEIEIVEKLKISYDGLKTVEKELFLDIACFWRGRTKDEAMEILEACDFHPEIGIEVLRQKALITIVDGSTFDMHDLIQEMGHYIVRGEHPNNPEKHSRVWKRDEVKEMCFGDATTKNDKIEAIRYDFYDDDQLSYFYKLVSNMKKLRYLKVCGYLKVRRYNAYKNGKGPTFLSNELRYIDWKGYPSSRFPDTFQPMKLVVLKVRRSMQKELWNSWKHLPHLKVLQLRSMEKLLSTPDFDALPCLQKLKLSHCFKLKEIHPSLGNHTSLQYVSVSSCRNLRMFPKIVHMKNLKSLQIMSCHKILEFPEIQASMVSLVDLSLKSIGLEVLPSSIEERCSNLISLNVSYLKSLKSIQFKVEALKHLKEFKFEGLIKLERKRLQLFYQFLHRLRKLDLGIWCFKNVEIPYGIVELSNLQELSLSGNDVSRLDFNISQLTQLKLLNLSGCKKLLELPELPSSLTILNANKCISLTTFGDCYKTCTGLCYVSLKDGSTINDGDMLLESMLEVCMTSENHYMLLQLQGLHVAKGFTPPLLKGRRCRLELRENWRNDFCGFLMCGVLPYYYPRTYVRISMHEEMGGMDSQHDVVWEEGFDDVHTVVWYVSFDSLRQSAWWNQTYKALEFNIGDEIGFTRCSGFGVRLIDKKNSSGVTQTSLNSSSSSSSYAPKFKIEHDSLSTSKIFFYNQ